MQSTIDMLLEFRHKNNLAIDNYGSHVIFWIGEKRWLVSRKPILVSDGRKIYGYSTLNGHRTYLTEIIFKYLHKRLLSELNSNDNRTESISL